MLGRFGMDDCGCQGILRRKWYQFAVLIICSNDLGLIDWLGKSLTFREHASGYMGRSCNGHEMGCLWLLPKPNTGFREIDNKVREMKQNQAKQTDIGKFVTNKQEELCAFIRGTVGDEGICIECILDGRMKQSRWVAAWIWRWFEARHILLQSFKVINRSCLWRNDVYYDSAYFAFSTLLLAVIWWLIKDIKTNTQGCCTLLPTQKRIDW